MTELEANLIREYTGFVAGVFSALMEEASEETRQKVRRAGEAVGNAFNDCVFGRASLAEFKKAISAWASLQLAAIEEARPKPKRKRAREITEKQRMFIDLYGRHLNASRAAREAGYSAKSARAIACENLKKPEIKAEIGKILEAHRLDVERRIAERR